MTIVAEADNPHLIGVNMKGKTDIAGTPFRDQIVQRALKREAAGWIYLADPGGERDLLQVSLFRLVEGSDNQEYIVVSGIYRPCK